MRLFKRKSYIERPELDGRLKKLKNQVNNDLERGSKIMREHHQELFHKPESTSSTSLFSSDLFKHFYGIDTGKPEPRSRITVLEKKLDLVLKELGLEIDWNSQVIKPHYTIKKKAAKSPKKAAAKKVTGKK